VGECRYCSTCFWPLYHIEVSTNFVTLSLYYLKYLTKYPMGRKLDEPLALGWIRWTCWED